MNNKTTERCFVILRSDTSTEEVTCKMVVWSIEEADKQIERLNNLNESKGCLYWYETSRALRRDI